jgi:protein TonB
MMAGRRDKVQSASDATALALCGALAVILWAARPDTWRDSAVAPADPSPPAVEVSLQTSPAPAAPAPAASAAPPDPPMPPARVAHKLPTPTPLPPLPRVPRTAPAVDTPVPELSSLPAEQTPPEGGALIASASASAAAAVSAAAADSRADLEAQYAAGLRADIDRRTHPPDSAQYRLHRPSGEVRVRFVVLRNGQPQDVRVLRSSGSSILDAAAVSLVCAGHYPPMPANIFSGEAEHVFAVTIEFRPPNT